MKAKLLIGLFALTTALVYSCKKEDKMVPLQIQLTDNPALYDAVNVHVTGMQVKINNETWININTKDTIVNLLDLQNGITEVMAQDTVPDGQLKEIRLILGKDNSVEEGGTIHPLTVPSGSESGLKIKIDKNLNETLNTFVLDFVVDESVKEEQDGYKLRPVIRLKQ